MTEAGVARATLEGHNLVYRDGVQSIVIQAWGRDGLRVRLTPRGGGQTSDWALDIPLEAAGEKEVATICRNAWAGSQRYGACPAPHDILSSFEHLEEHMKVGLNVAMSGIPWWTSTPPVRKRERGARTCVLPTTGSWCSWRGGSSGACGRA